MTKGTFDQWPENKHQAVKHQLHVSHPHFLDQRAECTMTKTKRPISSLLAGCLLLLAAASCTCSAHLHFESVAPTPTFFTATTSKRIAGIATNTPRQQESITSLNSVLQLPRGGAWYFGKKTAARKYRELLQEQVQTLEKQLRQSKDELALLRRQLKVSQSLLHRTGSPSLRTVSSEKQSEKLKVIAENNELKKKITSMTKEVGQLEKMRNDLKAVIEQQHKKMEELEEKLKTMDSDNASLVEKYEQQIERLKKDIDAKYQKQIEDLSRLYEKRVEEAEERGRQMVLRDVDARVEKATAEERAKYEKLLAEERRKSEAAIEREKVKMRKLAKALFERERKLNTLDKDLSNLDSSTNIKGQSSIPTSKTGQASHSVNPVRKF